MEMLKSKPIIIFIIMVLGVSYLAAVDNVRMNENIIENERGI